MNYLKQFSIILLFSLVGELLNHFIPLPVPASIYGIVLLFLSLMLGIVKLEHIEKSGGFLIEIMPVMFIPAAAGLINSWGVVKNSAVEYIATMMISTVAVMAVSGLVTQFVIRRGEKKHD